MTGTEDAEARALRYLPELLRGERVPAAEWPLGDDELTRLGLARSGDRLMLADPIDRLDPDGIRRALDGAAQRWVRRLEVWPAIGSTHAELVARGQTESIDGHVCMAEVQLAGRGRRGRAWLSPLGGNLALSMAFETDRAAADLAGFSVVTGLAVLDALEAEGVGAIALKWPNDILRDEGKLGGILVELVPKAGCLAIVVGVGLNVRLPSWVRADVEQKVADLVAADGSAPSRSRLAARTISAIVAFHAGFVEKGFRPFAAIFDDRHAFHGREVLIQQGATRTVGRVAGVAPDGGLLLRSDAGTVTVHAGEVSLRPT